MNIAIVDDQKEMIEIIINKLRSIQYEFYRFISVQDMEKSKLSFDLILLDIDMPDCDGIEYAREHKDENIVFITSHEERMKEAFGTNVYGFINKDDKDERYISVVQDTIQQIKDQKVVSLKCSYGFVKFVEKDIVYLMYIGYKTISLVYRDKSYTIKGYSLKDIKNILGEQFIQIDKSIIINSSMILCFINDELYLIGIAQSFPVSRRKKNIVRKV